jgi:predicted TIM-barrel fold metal-dependent hydrolase
MAGVQLSAHYGSLYLDDPAFEPLFCKLNEFGMTAYVHHTPVPVEYAALAGYNNLRRSYGRCVDQTTAVARELFSGMFKKYPRVKVVHSMLGGGFFAYLNMMLPPAPAGGEAAKRFDDGNAELRGFLRDNIFFEMSHAQPWGKAQLECAVQTLGADKILYGSSYPVRAEWMTGGPAFVRSLDIPEEEKDMILWKNAARLYRLETEGT